ncbi:MAG: GIY-YIG nuclease family protein [Cyclobacteriaceae bacterium]|nr:GIY-YIG nuclease family protein [Cyclobacteriaceae bacterium HetDA_MAG_MS6]
MEKGGAVYIMTNRHHAVYYTGVTSNLFSRVQEHKDKVYPKSFTAKYNADKLVYFEPFHSIEEAIQREKQIKKYRREKKLALIKAMNPTWKDLYEEVAQW